MTIEIMTAHHHVALFSLPFAPYSAVCPTVPSALACIDEPGHVPGGLYQVAPEPAPEWAGDAPGTLHPASAVATTHAPDWDALQQDWNTSGLRLRSSLFQAGNQ